MKIPKIKSLSLIVLLLLSFIVVSCCKEELVELDKQYIEDEEMNFIPYKKGDTLLFIDSLGKKWAYRVTKDELFWNTIYFPKRDEGQCFQEYQEHEERLTFLKSDLYNLDLNITSAHSIFVCAGAIEYTVLDFGGLCSVEYVYQEDYKLFLDDRNGIYHDTITIYGRLYHDVMEKECQIGEGKSFDNFIIPVPKIVFFNQKYGILRIITNRKERYDLYPK